MKAKGHNEQPFLDDITSPHRIRNVAIIAHVDHGKSTLTDSLVAHADLLRSSAAGSARWTDTHVDEVERGITIKAAALSVPFLHSDPTLDMPPPPAASPTQTPYRLNVIDSPGHVDFSAEVSAALRVADGAIIVIDIIDGVCVQTECVARLAIAERVRPIVVINKVDRAAAQLRLDDTHIARRAVAVVKDINDRVALMVAHSDGSIPAWIRSPLARSGRIFDIADGTAILASGKGGWAISARTAAAFYAPRTAGSASTAANTLAAALATDAGIGRYLVRPLIDPSRAESVHAVVATAAALGPHVHHAVTHAVPDTVGLPSDHGVALLAGVLARSAAPAAVCLLDAIVAHLPSPVDAMPHRVDAVYTPPTPHTHVVRDGPHLHDPDAHVSADVVVSPHPQSPSPAALAITAAITHCDAACPTAVFCVTRVVPVGSAAKTLSSAARYVAFGRVYCGTLKGGDRVAVLSNGRPPTVATASACVRMIGNRAVPVAAAVAGDIVAVVGIDTCITKTATVISPPPPQPTPTSTSTPAVGTFAGLSLAVAPVVCVSVRATRPSDTPKVAVAVARLTATEALAEVTAADDGTFVVKGAGELHVDICCKDIERLAGVPLTRGQPAVPYKESVGRPSEHVVIGKSDNGLNRVHGVVRPLPPALVDAIADGNIAPIAKGVPTTATVDAFVRRGGWHADAARRVVYVSTDGVVVVNKSVGLSHTADVVAAVVDVVAAAVGVASGETLHAVLVDIVDAKTHADPAHRNPRQLQAAARRMLRGALADASPALYEPIYAVSVTVPNHSEGAVYGPIASRRGVVVAAAPAGASARTVTAHVPVATSFGLVDALRGATRGHATVAATVAAWERVDGDVNDPSSQAAVVATMCRARNRIPGDLPTLEAIVGRAEVRLLPKNVDHDHDSATPSMAGGASASA